MAISDRMLKAIDLYLKGANKTEAMKGAGFSEKTAQTRHSTYFGDEEVKAEIMRRQNIAASRTDITLEKMLTQLNEIASASLGDLITVDPDGSISMDYSKLTPELRKSIGNVTVDEITEGRGDEAKKVKRIRIGALDRIRAIELIIRHAGLSKEKVVVAHEGDLVERLRRGRLRAAGTGEEAE